MWPPSSKIYRERHLNEKNYLRVVNIPVIAEGHLVNRILQLEQYVFCITITDLRNLAFKVGEINRFSLAMNKDKYRWKEMVVWFHEKPLTTKCGATTC